MIIATILSAVVKSISIDQVFLMIQFCLVTIVSHLLFHGLTLSGLEDAELVVGLVQVLLTDLQSLDSTYLLCATVVLTRHSVQKGGRVNHERGSLVGLLKDGLSFLLEVGEDGVRPVVPDVS